MELDYKKIGARIARRRRQLGLKQSEVEELAEIGYKYLSNIERGISVPSTEVIMRLAAALDTTPDEFLVGTAHSIDPSWHSVADRLRSMSPRQLSLVDTFLDWLSQQDL